MRIALVISSLAAGGAERVMTSLADHWAGQGHHICLLTLTPPAMDHYPLHSSIQRRVYAADTSKATTLGRIADNFRRINDLRKALDDVSPDVVVSFMSHTNITTLLATMFSRYPTVISERISPQHYDIGRGWNLLRRLTYPLCKALVIQSESTRPWAQRVVRPRRVHVLPNPVVPPSQDLLNASGIDLPQSPYIAAMGRIVHQKGFDLLMKAFSRLAPARPDWRLAIIGGSRNDNTELEGLETLSRELGIADQVVWCGEVGNPFPLLANADIFALPSRFEGFPNALVEAMACGVPAVAFDCPTGPADIVVHNANGLLVPAEDTDALTKALASLMEDKKLRNRLGEQARDVTKLFSQTSILDQWDQLLVKATRPRSQPTSRKN